MKRSTLIACWVLILSLASFAWGAEKKVVRVWHTETEPQTIAAFQQIINDFEKLHPDITIKQEGLAWGDLEAKLTAALAAGSPPDASHGQAVTCASFYAKGLLRDQEDIADSIGRDNIWEAVRRQCFHDGKYYGIPHSAATSLLIYRKDIFKAKGLKPPETWDEFIKMAEAMMERDKDGRVTRYGLSLPGVGLFINIAVGELTKANGGRLFDLKTGRPTFTEKQVIEVLDFYKKLSATVLPPGWLGHGYLDTFANLATGKAAILYQGYGRGAGYIEKYAPKGTADPDHFGVHGEAPRTIREGNSSPDRCRALDDLQERQVPGRGRRVSEVLLQGGKLHQVPPHSADPPPAHPQVRAERTRPTRPMRWSASGRSGRTCSTATSTRVRRSRP